MVCKNDGQLREKNIADISVFFCLYKMFVGDIDPGII
jgi:hypothetical protein